MEELLVRVNIQIADRPYKLSVEPELEPIVRKAAKMIHERLVQCRKDGHTDNQEALGMIAFDCLVNQLRGEQKMQRLQQMVFDKITQLDQAVTPVIST